MLDPVIDGVLADLSAEIEDNIDTHTTSEHEKGCIADVDGVCTGQHYLDTLTHPTDRASFNILTAEGRMFTVTVTEVTK